MRSIYLFCAAAILMLSACSKDGGTSGASTNNCADVSCKPAGNVETTYYTQFMSQIEGTCADPDSIRFLALGTAEQVKLGTVNGKDLIADLTLHLLEDGSYIGNYGERLISSSNSSEILFGKQLQGRWLVENTKITLEGLGVGNKLMVGDRARVLFKVQTVQHDSRIVSPMIKLDLVKLPFGPNGESGAEYCGKTN